MTFRTFNRKPQAYVSKRARLRLAVKRASRAGTNGWHVPELAKGVVCRRHALRKLTDAASRKKTEPLKGSVTNEFPKSSPIRWCKAASPRLTYAAPSGRRCSSGGSPEFVSPMATPMQASRLHYENAQADKLLKSRSTFETESLKPCRATY